MTNKRPQSMQYTPRQNSRNTVKRRGGGGKVAYSVPYTLTRPTPPVLQYGRMNADGTVTIPICGEVS